jgi:hypothetical protein
VVQPDDVDRIDQEPMFIEGGSKKPFPIADAYDGNNVAGGTYQVRPRHPALSAAEVARARALSKTGGKIDLALLKGDTILALTFGDWTSTTSKRLVVHNAPKGVCAKTEDWQLPDDLDSAFDPAPP